MFMIYFFYVWYLGKTFSVENFFSTLLSTYYKQLIISLLSLEM